MAKIIYLSPSEQMPDHGDEEPWLVVEASDDGRFYGTGAAWKPSGEWVGYRCPRMTVPLPTPWRQRSAGPLNTVFQLYGFKLLHRSAYAQTRPFSC